MKKFFDVEIDGQVELENGKTIGKLEESNISITNPDIEGGNAITKQIFNVAAQNQGSDGWMGWLIDEPSVELGEALWANPMEVSQTIALQVYDNPEGTGLPYNWCYTPYQVKREGPEIDLYFAIGGSNSRTPIVAVFGLCYNHEDGAWSQWVTDVYQ